MEIGEPGVRSQNFNIKNNEEELRCNLDLLKEARDLATIRAVKYKSQISQYYNKCVQRQYFKSGDLLLRKNIVSQQSSVGELDPNWSHDNILSRILQVSQPQRAPYTMRVEWLQPQKVLCLNLY